MKLMNFDTAKTFPNPQMQADCGSKLMAFCQKQASQAFKHKSH